MLKWYNVRDIWSNITVCLQEFPRASPSGTPSGVYLTVYPYSRPNTDTITPCTFTILRFNIWNMTMPYMSSGLGGSGSLSSKGRTLFNRNHAFQKSSNNYISSFILSYFGVNYWRVTLFVCVFNTWHHSALKNIPILYNLLLNHWNYMSFAHHVLSMVRWPTVAPGKVTSVQFIIQFYFVKCAFYWRAFKSKFQILHNLLRNHYNSMSFAHCVSTNVRWYIDAHGEDTCVKLTILI